MLQNHSEDVKQKLDEYRKNIMEWEEMPYYNYKIYFNLEKLIFKMYLNRSVSTNKKKCES